MSDRKKLETKIERQIHALISEVKEHVEDFTVLTVRKKHPEVSRDQLATTLSIVRQAIDDGFMTKIDRFMNKLDKDLAEFTNEDELPLDSSSPKKGKKSK